MKCDYCGIKFTDTTNIISKHNKLYHVECFVARSHDILQKIKNIIYRNYSKYAAY